MKLIKTRDVNNDCIAVNPAAVESVESDGDDCVVTLRGGNVLQVAMPAHDFADLLALTVAQGEADKAASAARAFGGSIAEMAMSSPMAGPLLMKLVGPAE